LPRQNKIKRKNKILVALNIIAMKR
jgi:hypothetical protein